MAVTVNTLLQSAKSRGSFVGVTLRTANPDIVQVGAVKVQSISPSYVRLVVYGQNGEPNRMRVRRNTVRAVRLGGVQRVTRAR